MKKALIVLVLLAAVFGFAAAQAIDLGTIPVGQWLDENYNALWELTSGNILIKDNADTPLWSFAEKGFEDNSLKPSTTGVTLTWSCAAAGDSGKTYILKYTIGKSDLELTIKRAEYPDYTVILKKQDK